MADSLQMESDVGVALYRRFTMSLATLNPSNSDWNRAAGVDPDRMNVAGDDACGDPDPVELSDPPQAVTRATASTVTRRFNAILFNLQPGATQCLFL